MVYLGLQACATNYYQKSVDIALIVMTNTLQGIGTLSFIELECAGSYLTFGVVE